MKTLLTLFILISTFSLTAQTTTSMTGTWKFDSLYEAEKFEKEAVEMLSSMFSDMVFTLKTDGTYNLKGMGESEDGTWSYNEKSKELELISAAKESTVFEIIELKDNKAVFSKDKMTLVMLKK